MAAMVVGVCSIQLSMPGNRSLKDKRSVLKSLMARVRQKFNVSIAEVDRNQAWQRAVLGVACVSNGADYAQGLLLSVVKAIENGRLDAQVVDYQIEIL